MELSVRSKFMSEEMLEKRRQMIEREDLHINGKLTKEVFDGLHKKYGANLIKKDFAWFFLDINDVNYDKFEKGKTLEAVILSYEYVSNEELKEIRARIIEKCSLQHGDGVTYNQVLEMYDQFSGRLSMSLFLEEILGLTVQGLSKLRTGAIKEKAISFEAEPGEYHAFHGKTEKVPMYVLNPEYIYEIRKRLASEAGLHIGDNISYAQIQELSKQFCPDMPEMLFAQKMIDMSTIQYNTLKRVNTNNPINGLVFQYADIPSEYIDELQEKIIKKHKLESRQLLKYEEFQMLYDEYGGLLSKKNFATLVLDISNENYSHFNAGTYQSVFILNSTKGTDFNVLRERIVREYKLHCEDLVKYDQFKVWHQKFAPNSSEFIFAEKVLGITDAAFQAMKYRDGRARIHLKLPTPEEMENIQKEIVIRENLHINDKINYAELKRLHEMYGGVLSLRAFATKILYLDEPSIYRLKSNEEAEAFVFFHLEITDSAIKRIKQKVMLEYDLQKPRNLSPDKIKKIYAAHGGMMSLLMFIREILGINGVRSNDLSNEKYKSIRVHIKIKFDEKDPTDLSTYEKVKMLREQEKSPEEIVEELRVSPLEVRAMLRKYKTEQEEAKRLEIKQSKLDEKEQKRKKIIENRARRALDEYELDDKSIQRVRAYIAECKADFEKGKFSKEDLDFLMECMIFIQCNCKEIELYCRICVFFKAYRRASNFIMENIDNEGILPEEAMKLMDLQENIQYAIKKQTAMKMLRSGNRDVGQIAETTGVLEVDVIGMRRLLDAERVTVLSRNNSQPEGQSYGD